jgi:imidazolonepropionase-like amidohydrolase
MMRKGIWFALVVLILTPVVAHAQVTAIKAGKLVDPETGTTSTNQIILVEGGKIKAVGAGLQVPAGATVIDLSKATVLPGLFDCHTHLCLTSMKPRGQSWYSLTEALLSTVLTTTTGYRAVLGVANARSMLDAGFTTVRDVGNAGNYADSDLRRAVEEGLVPGPTIINAGRIIAPYGGQFAGGVLQPEKRDLGNPEYIYADTRDELKKGIRENILYGARVIKIVVDDQPYIYSADDIKFIVEEATNAGVKVAAHCTTDRGCRNAIEGGVASIEHAFGVGDEVLDLAKKKGVVLVGTDFTDQVAKEGGLPPEWRAAILDRLKRAYKLGLTMAFGTDVFINVPGHTRGSASLSYIDSFVDAGIPAKAIVQAMTTNAARLLGVENGRGAIRPGLAADIIATTENPLDNIQALKNVTFVMKDGQVFKGLTH